jgi:hypothetical protein
VLPTGETSWAAAAIDRDIEVGDTLRTGPASAAKVLLIDETILTLGESTELLIDSYIVGSDATRDPSVLKLLKGKARVLVGEAFGGPTRVEMHTPTAVIGVKGTEFEAQVIEEAGVAAWTLVCNLDGSVFVRPLDPALAGSVEPRPGLCTQVFPDQPPEREIPRPVRFPPVQTLKRAPAPGTAETLVFGSAGVAAVPAGGDTGVDSWVVEEAGGPDLTDDTFDSERRDLGTEVFEDPVQAQQAIQGGLSGPDSSGLNPGTPQTP